MRASDSSNTVSEFCENGSSSYWQIWPTRKSWFYVAQHLTGSFRPLHFQMSADWWSGWGRHWQKDSRWTTAVWSKRSFGEGKWWRGLASRWCSTFCQSERKCQPPGINALSTLVDVVKYLYFRLTHLWGSQHETWKQGRVGCAAEFFEYTLALPFQFFCIGLECAVLPCRIYVLNLHFLAHIYQCIGVVSTDCLTTKPTL